MFSKSLVEIFDDFDEMVGVLHAAISAIKAQILSSDITTFVQPIIIPLKLYHHCLIHSPPRDVKAARFLC